MPWLYPLIVLAAVAVFAIYSSRRSARRSSRQTPRQKTGAPAGRRTATPEDGTLKDRPLRRDNLSKEVELDWEASEVIEFQPGAYAKPRDFKDEPTKGQLRRTGELGALDESTLPSRYGRDRLVLMARDPRWVYAYWEIAHQKYHDMYEKHLEQWGLSRPVLRLYDLTPAPGQSNEIDVPLRDEADNWYVRVDRPDHTVIAEIGRLFEDKFIPLARSNQITLPPGSVSSATSEEWSPPDWEATYGRYTGDDVPTSPQKWGK